MEGLWEGDGAVRKVMALVGKVMGLSGWQEGGRAAALWAGGEGDGPRSERPPSPQPSTRHAG